LLLTTGDSRAFDSIRGRHGYVLTFENVSNAQWIGSEVGLSPPNIGLLAEPKKSRVGDAWKDSPSGRPAGRCFERVRDLNTYSWLRWI